MRKLIICIDGGARGNPGPAAVGIAVYNEQGQTLKEWSEYIGEATNNEAEYTAAITALKKLKQWLGKKLALASDITMKSDSEFLVKQMKGKYKVQKPEIQQLFLELWNLSLDYENLKIQKIAREKNERADALVNEALDEQEQKQELL